VTLSHRLEKDPIEEAWRQWTDRGWGEAADGMASVTSIVRAHQIILHRIDSVLRPLKLSFARFEILTLLSFTKQGSLPMTKMGSLLQVHPTSVTSAVDRLENQKLVERVMHPTDRRAVLASITDLGRLRALEATALLNNQVFSDIGISPHQTKQLTKILCSLRSNAGDF
jgi:DNA-binding MarR family transcriptional regulator